MSNEQRPGRRASTLALILVLGWVLAAEPILAAICNNNSCWDLGVKRLLVKSNGDVWIIGDDPAAMANLAPNNGCTIESQPVGGGNSEPSVYLRGNDPRHSDKYLALLTAYTTGVRVQIFTEPDPDNNLCSLAEIRLF